MFHQAAIRITQCAEEPRLALEVLADGTFNVLEAAVNAKVSQGRRRVVGLGLRPRRAASRRPRTHHPYNNRTIYGAAKAFNEGLLRSFNDMYGLDYVALRYFNVYGPRMDVYGAYTEVLIRWMERIAAGQPPLIFGDGLQTMDFVHVARHRARQRPGRAVATSTDEVFNVASGIETSLIELAERCCKVMGSHLAPEHGAGAQGQPGAAAAGRHEQGAATCSASSAKVGLEEGLRDLVEWWQQRAGGATGAAA